MIHAAPATDTDRAIRAAKAAGLPQQQLRYFLAAGYMPQPKQMEFHAYARAADEPGGPEHIALGGARGPGKSHAVMAQAALDDSQRRPGLTTLFLRKVGKAAAESLDQLRQRVFMSVPHSYDRRGIVRFENGSKIIVGNFRVAADIDKYLGLEYDTIAIEEATQLPKRHTTQLLGSLRTSKEDWRARTYRTTNPGGVGHTDFKREFVTPQLTGREKDGNTRFIPATYLDNAFLSAGYIRYLENLTGTLRLMWRNGDWNVGAGMFFTNWRDDLHVIRPFGIPTGWHMWGALDYGWVHPTAVTFHTVDPNTRVVYTVAEYGQGRRSIAYHAGEIKRITVALGRRPGSVPFVAGRDAFAKGKDGRTVSSHYNAHGIHLSHAKTGRIQGAAALSNRLGNPADEDTAPSWYVFRTCRRTIEQIPAMLADPHRPEDVLKVNADEEEEGGDDFYDANRYGLMERPLTSSFGTRY